MYITHITNDNEPLSRVCLFYEDRSIKIMNTKLSLDIAWTNLCFKRIKSVKPY